MGLGDAFEIFVTFYTQTHMLFGDDSVKFDEVALSATNEELRISSAKDGGVAMFARSSQGKKSKPAKSGGDNDGGGDAGGDANREVCNSCKTTGRKHAYPVFKC